MKRFGKLYKQIYSVENLYLADQKARKGKHSQYGVKVHDQNQDANIWDLHLMLKNKSYKTSAYKTFPIYEPKERIIFCLPYFPDRITHHAIMNVMERIFVSTFTTDTYSCIKGKGIHAASYALRESLKDASGTKYCLKIDIKKFYPSIDHDILKGLIRRKIKDKDLLWLLDGIIDSAPGLPIGNLLSQYLANFYLCYFDHWVKEEKRVKDYFRYADDIVIPSDNKEHLHQLLADFRVYLRDNLKLEIKYNYQIFKVAAHHKERGKGIDFVGYVHYHEHIRMRKSIKKNFARKVSKTKNRKTIASYQGWAKHCNSKHLLKKLLNEKL
jgi:RNA-directed DNA polymerase